MNFRSKSNYHAAAAVAKSEAGSSAAHSGAGLLSTNWDYAKLSSASSVLEQRGFIFADDSLMNKDTRSAYNLVDVDQLIRRKRRSRLQVSGAPLQPSLGDHLLILVRGFVY